MPFILPFLPAIATVGAAAIGAASTSRAAKSAAKSQADATAANAKIQQEQTARNTALLQPFVDDGRGANDVLGGLLGLSGDPNKAHEALDTFLGSTNYGFVFDQGQRAVTGSAAARGMLGSGATLKALQDRGQNTARSYIGDYMDRLTARVGTGINAAGAIAGEGTHLADTLTAGNRETADARGNAALIGAQGTNNVLATALGLYGQNRGASSYGPKTTQPANDPVFATLPTARPSYLPTASASYRF